MRSRAGGSCLRGVGSRCVLKGFRMSGGWRGRREFFVELGVCGGGWRRICFLTISVQLSVEMGDRRGREGKGREGRDTVQ